jgi:hypothetical protein
MNAAIITRMITMRLSTIQCRSMWSRTPCLTRCPVVTSTLPLASNRAQPVTVLQFHPASLGGLGMVGRLMNAHSLREVPAGAS